VAVTVLPQVEIVAGAMQPDRQQADATPVVEPTVDERQLGRLSLDSVAASAARRRPATDFTAVFPEGAWPKSSSRWKGRVPQKPIERSQGFERLTHRFAGYEEERDALDLDIQCRGHGIGYRQLEQPITPFGRGHLAERKAPLALNKGSYWPIGDSDSALSPTQ